MLAFFRALRVDLAKALWGRWFVIAVLATLFSLWLGISQQLRGMGDYLMYNDEPHWARMLDQALQGSFAQLSLPALSALPAAGLALCWSYRPVLRAAPSSAWAGSLTERARCWPRWRAVWRCRLWASGC